MKHDEAHEQKQNAALEALVDALYEHIAADPKSDRNDRTLAKLAESKAMLAKDDQA